MIFFVVLLIAGWRAANDSHAKKAMAMLSDEDNSKGGFDAPTRPKGVGPPPPSSGARRPSEGKIPIGSGQEPSMEDLSTMLDHSATGSTGLEEGIAEQQRRAAMLAGKASKKNAKTKDDRRPTRHSSATYAQGLKDAPVDELRRAFVLGEILGPPTALKDPDERLPY